VSPPDRPEHDASSDAERLRARVEELERRLAELEKADRAHRAGELRLRQIIDLVPHMIFAKDHDGRFLLANRTVADAYGLTVEELLGRGHETVHDAGEEVSRMLADDREVIDSGKGKFIPAEIFTDCHGAQRILQTTKIPFTESGSNTPAMLGVAVDITERTAAEQRQIQMMRELDHRVKNNLAAVLSIAEQTVNGAQSLDEFAVAFTGRVRSMAIAHEMLAQSKWQGADLHGMLERVLAPYVREAESPFSCSGPAITLPAAVTQCLCMVLHELVTNAAKYGALSAPDGRVAIEWQRERPGQDHTQLRLTWIERNGPPVIRPTRSGFGTVLIEQMIAYELHGHAKLTYEKPGLTCTMLVPLTFSPSAGAEDG
jgi:PAS domain S-box-containing protein